MKVLNLLLLISILGISISDEPDICSTQFEQKIKSECENLDSTCSLTSFSPRCLSIKNEDCLKGDGNEATCNSIFPSEFPLKKCVYDSENKKCNKEETICTDFNTGVNGVFFNENKDYCGQLKANNDQSSCRFSFDGNCESHSNSCDGLSQTECDKNYLSETKKCFYDTSDGTCKEETNCDGHILRYITETQCHNLKTSDETKKKCVYSRVGCRSQYINCEDVPSPNYTQCRLYTPLINKGNYYDYNYFKICGYSSSKNECSESNRYCTEYTGEDASICIQTLAHIQIELVFFIQVELLISVIMHIHHVKLIIMHKFPKQEKFVK